MEKVKTDPVSTIGEHYRRQATSEVWAEIDELRGRSGWKPIETAPQDGTPMLLYSPDGRIGLGYFEPQEFGGCKWVNQSAAWIGKEDGRVRLVFGGYEPGDATHWALLPNPSSAS